VACAELACAEHVEVWRKDLCFEAGSWKQEVGSGKLEAGRRKQEMSSDWWLVQRIQESKT
jgi:hypothetical protein